MKIDPAFFIITIMKDLPKQKIKRSACINSRHQNYHVYFFYLVKLLWIVFSFNEKNIFYIRYRN